MSDQYALRSHSPEETRLAGGRLAAELEPGSVVSFHGDLGTGKTCMIQGVCQALHVDDYVTSPTFILINEYAGALRGAPIDIYHFDLYRLFSAAELEDLGAEEYFYGQGICLIEWPERASELLPASCLKVALEHAGPEERLITVRRPPTQ